MQERKVSTLPLLRKNGKVAGMYLWSDVSRIYRDSEQFNVDENRQLRVAAAVSTGSDTLERVDKIKKYLDVVVIDTADGDSYYAFQTLRDIKTSFPDLDVVVGNISDGESARLLAEAGANGIKVGQGPGSICTTRRETGIGTPQVTAIYNAVKELGPKYANIPICADGGISDHGDIAIAMATGASTVMMGRMLAGTKEAPGVIITRNGNRYKFYRGMGSKSALMDNAASRQRYDVKGTGLILAEGIEALVPYEGEVSDVLDLCTQALLKSMRYAKAPDLDDFRNRARFLHITNAGLRESHPHDVEITQQ
jgi:IMP dehydrogenase